MFHVDALTTPARTHSAGRGTSYIYNDDWTVTFYRALDHKVTFTDGRRPATVETTASDVVGHIRVHKSSGQLSADCKTFADFLNHPASVLVPDAFLTSASVVLPVVGMPSDAFICIFAGDADCKHKLFYVRVDRGPDRRDVVTHVRLGANALCRLLQRAVDLERIERAMNVNLPDDEAELQIVDARIAALEDLIDDWLK